MLLPFINSLIYYKENGWRKNVNLLMLVIRLTITEPFASIFSAVSSVLVEQCDPWIHPFHLHLGLHGTPSVECALLLHPTRERLVARIWCSQMKGLAEWAPGGLARKRGLWIPSPCGVDAASLSHPEQCSQYLGNMKCGSSCLWHSLLCSWHIWTHWIFNSFLNPWFCWIFTFSPNGGLTSDTLKWRDSLYILWNIISVFWLTSALFMTLTT